MDDLTMRAMEYGLWTLQSERTFAPLSFLFSGYLAGSVKNCAMLRGLALAAQHHSDMMALTGTLRRESA